MTQHHEPAAIPFQPVGTTDSNANHLKTVVRAPPLKAQPALRPAATSPPLSRGTDAPPFIVLRKALTQVAVLQCSDPADHRLAGEPAPRPQSASFLPSACPYHTAAMALDLARPSALDVHPHWLDLARTSALGVQPQTPHLDDNSLRTAPDPDAPAGREHMCAPACAARASCMRVPRKATTAVCTQPRARNHVPHCCCPAPVAAAAAAWARRRL